MMKAKISEKDKAAARKAGKLPKPPKKPKKSASLDALEKYLAAVKTYQAKIKELAGKTRKRSALLKKVF